MSQNLHQPGTERRMACAKGGIVHAFFVSPTSCYVDFVDDWYGEQSHDWITPLGWVFAKWEPLERDDCYSHHESPVRMWFKPAPKLDSRSLTHRLPL